ncbi:hypothetical protein PsYK624_104160 [Phanerochaete sordida]|uniref:Uncharacterized protein n=1 Tax=Phanerochaete sordida TaxID=48140 RepID=A0A9P3GG29_9APHY|nr:hypothetical protein PsYK624_104160 [Phanerochaete sordida]
MNRGTRRDAGRWQRTRRHASISTSATYDVLDFGRKLRAQVAEGLGVAEPSTSASSENAETLRDMDLAHTSQRRHLVSRVV